MMFRVEKLKKNFGGLTAVNDVTFSLEKGEVSSIIGPNGAGKTTLFNLITGHLKPNSGSVHFKDREITGLPPHRVCQSGIGRSFQKTNIFPKLTTFDNVQMALMSWQR
jgi:branched-chain amino acid transport system ATP-binding protein